MPTSILDSLAWRAAEPLFRMGREAWRASRARRGPRRETPLLAELEDLLEAGDRARARELAGKRQAELGGTLRGAGILETVGIATPDVLPGGRPNPLALARRVESGDLDGDAVERILLRHPRALLANPQLHLLVFMAHLAADPARAEAALRRFFRANGLPRCTIAHEGPAFPASLHFAPPRPTSGPLVSVIVAAYNAAATVERAIDSVLAQSYRDLEILACDDASYDSTLAVITQRFAGEPRVRLFRSVANQGPYNIRNQLLPHARGRFITFHDADDVALPSRLAAQVRHLERTGASACLTAYFRMSASGHVVFHRDQSAVRMCMASMMSRREALGACGQFRAVRFGADLEMVHALAARLGELRVLRQPQVVGLCSSASLSRQDGAESREDGYRSPVRRAYAKLVAGRRGGAHGQEATKEAATEAAIDELMRTAGARVEPTEVVPVT